METAAPRRLAHRISWGVFAGMLLFSAQFIYRTARELPARTAVHFDAGGNPDALMASAEYRHFILFFAIVLPIALVATLTLTYSRSANLKIPNGNYWLAPQRIIATRAFLIAHGTWLGSLLAAMMCFTHWLVISANRRAPPHLANEAVFLGLAAFLVCTLVWMAVLMIKFRRTPDA